MNFLNETVFYSAILYQPAGYDYDGSLRFRLLVVMAYVGGDSCTSLITCYRSFWHDVSV